MTGPSATYRPSLALLTDLYQLTMAFGYWKHGRADREAAFHLFFRRCPFGGGYAVAAGLEYVLDFVAALRFDRADLAYLGGLAGSDGEPLFEQGFLDYLARLEFRVDIAAVPEGTVVFPGEPLLRITGPIPVCQLLETPLLNLVNFQTLIATKAARICCAAGGRPVLEFGLRRAQGIDGALAAGRAAYIGGCAATSNVLAGRLFGIPVRGTIAHSWVMSFADEREAFEAWAEAMPANCLLVVDTYDTLEGVRNAIGVARRLRERGRALAGVRLDSGDLAALSVEARRLLDEAGFPDVRIVASGDLDEYRIEAIRKRGAAIDAWGVGTRLATAYDEPALGGVYKLAAVREPGEEAWRPCVKVSQDPGKSTTPGVLQVRRFRAGERFVGDVVYDVELGPGEEGPAGAGEAAGSEDLLVEVVRGGRVVYDPPALEAVRDRAAAQVAALDEAVRRLRDPEAYPVALERRLAQRRRRLIDRVRAERGHRP